jgi:hypothetical protein
MVPEVVERIIEYDDTARTLTYQADGLPSFLGTARNQWRVEAIDEQHTRVSLEATLQVRGVLGRLAYLMLRLQLSRTAPRFLQDLKYYVEHGRPSPRKQRRIPQVPNTDTPPAIRTDLSVYDVPLADPPP